MFRGNDPVHFLGLSTALLTLFRVVTLEDWTDVMYIQMYGSDAYPNYAEFAHAHLREASRSMPVLGEVFFVSFVLLGTMIMLSLFIGVSINSMAEAEKEAEERRRHIDRDGEISIGDEIRLIESEMEKLSRRLVELRRRTRGDGPTGGLSEPAVKRALHDFGCRCAVLAGIFISEIEIPIRSPGRKYNSSPTSIQRQPLKFLNQHPIHHMPSSSSQFCYGWASGKAVSTLQGSLGIIMFLAIGLVNPGFHAGYPGGCFVRHVVFLVYGLRRRPDLHPEKRQSYPTDTSIHSNIST